MSPLVVMHPAFSTTLAVRQGGKAVEKSDRPPTKDVAELLREIMERQASMDKYVADVIDIYDQMLEVYVDSEREYRAAVETARSYGRDAITTSW
jgi:hypothetical protein